MKKYERKMKEYEENLHNSPISLHIGRKLGIFPSPRAYNMRIARSSYVEGEGSKFFQDPEPRRKLGIFPSRRNMKKI